LRFLFFGNATRGYVDTPSLFAWWFGQWFDDLSETSHGPLILLAALWLLWRNLSTHKGQVEGRGSPRAAALMCLALLLHGMGYLVQQTRISAAAFLLFCWGLAWFAGGRRWRKASAFPLAFLLFSLPMGFVMDFVGFPLRLAVSHLSEAAAGLCGIEVVRVGTQLSSPDGTFGYDVAPACSGIRSLLALTALCVLLGYTAFQSLWRRALLGLLALPLALAGNVVRIYSIIVAGALFGQEAGRRVHDYSGFVTFAVALGLALLLVELLRRRLPESGTVAGAEAPPQSHAPVPWPALAAVSVVALSSIVLALRLDAAERNDAPGIRVDASGAPGPLPGNLGFEWIGIPASMSEAERELLPADTGFGRRLYVGLDGSQVLLSLVLSGADRSSIHRPELCLVGQGWEVESSRVASFELGGGRTLPMTVLAVHRGGEPDRPAARALFAYFFVSGDKLAASHLERMWSDVKARLGGHSPRWAYIIAQTPCDDGEAAALHRLGEVASRFLTEIRAPWTE